MLMRLEGNWNRHAGWYVVWREHWGNSLLLFQKLKYDYPMTQHFSF